MKVLVSVAVLAVALVAAGCQTTKEATNLAQLDVDFAWKGEHRCSSVSPAFQISGVPTGTASLKFVMTDLDVPTYRHGGGVVPYTGQATVAEGAFSYVGPCPPSGSHRYEFQVQAINGAGDVILGKGKAVRAFPPASG
ncbi:MAG: YbhB/YbcL family Raf kinase inhibitor-like protein [Minwuia sp.]|nr:YbhB/YbcL family Raf kinase inhibitor-like protein [Minwuia sp.]